MHLDIMKKRHLTQSGPRYVSECRRIPVEKTLNHGSASGLMKLFQPESSETPHKNLLVLQSPSSFLLSSWQHDIYEANDSRQTLSALNSAQQAVGLNLCPLLLLALAFSLQQTQSHSCQG